MERSLRLQTGPAGAVAAALSVAALMTAPAQGDAVEQNFSVATTADLVALCDTDPDDPNMIAAIQFCRGFGVGAYQYYLALAANDPAAAYVCLPDPPPSRDTVRTAFVVWARANPDEMSRKPVDSLFRYLAETYPCPNAGR